MSQLKNNTRLDSLNSLDRAFILSTGQLHCLLQDKEWNLICSSLSSKKVILRNCICTLYFVLRKDEQYVLKTSGGTGGLRAALKKLNNLYDSLHPQVACFVYSFLKPSHISKFHFQLVLAI